MNKVRQFVVYAKITFIGLIVILLLIVVFKNRTYKTRFWPWADQNDVSTLWLMLATSIVSIGVFWIFARLRRVFRDLAEIRRDQKQQETVREQDRLRRELDEQKRRIDERLKPGGVGSPDKSQDPPPGTLA